MFKRVALVVLGALVCYLLVAYVVVPAFYARYAQRHPALEDVPGITYAGDGHPGDPLNVALVGSKVEVIKIMLKARWYPSDALSIKADLEIAEATVLKRPYDEAPVSSLYLFGRKEDM